ncbi:hypothetical protein QJS10_CPA09g01969 [Acorus calamus]|uniref:Protein JASON n=1 Tax=Acorus calamus TaxID=4465 RepID=A0AAV9E3H5_ACOCL|nr:hypothetical protein QJS10_CPA09g01969 [Acorus calamus]
MGCFLACFGGPKEQKRRRRRRSPPRNQVPGDYISLQPTPTLSPKELPVVPPEDSVPDLRETIEGVGCGSIKKKVSFNLDVTTYSEVPDFDDANGSDGEREKAVEEEKGGTGELVRSCLESKTSFNSSHRYHNWTGSDDEDEAGFEVCDFDDEEEDDGDLLSEDDEGSEEEPEESYDSVFSLPLREGQISPSSMGEKANGIGGSSPDRRPSLLSHRAARDRSQYVHSVLNPVENLSQWKSIKSKKPPLEKHPRKENINMERELEIPFSPEPTFKIKKAQISLCDKPNLDFEKVQKQEVSVDASLSNWLAPPVSTPPRMSISGKSGSTVSKEDRPILGALTLEEIKLASVNSSPRRSRSKSPDDMPILGTVGSYWKSRDRNVEDLGSEGIPNTTNKYREDKKVNWHATPFEVRLERALARGDADAYSSFPPTVC